MNPLPTMIISAHCHLHRDLRLRRREVKRGLFVFLIIFTSKKIMMLIDHELPQRMHEM